MESRSSSTWFSKKKNFLNDRMLQQWQGLKPSFPSLELFNSYKCTKDVNFVSIGFVCVADRMFFASAVWSSDWFLRFIVTSWFHFRYFLMNLSTFKIWTGNPVHNLKQLNRKQKMFFQLTQWKQKQVVAVHGLRFSRNGGMWVFNYFLKWHTCVTSGSVLALAQRCDATYTRLANGDVCV